MKYTDKQRPVVQHVRRSLSAGDGSVASSSSNFSHSSHSSGGSTVSVSPMSSISNQFSGSSSNATSGVHINVAVKKSYCFMLCNSFSTDVLQQILKEVKASNSRIAELEKKQEVIQESTSVSRGGKKKIIEPSPEVRVNAAVHH